MGLEILGEKMSSGMARVELGEERFFPQNFDRRR